MFYYATAAMGFANFGLAIVLITLVFKIVLYPLTVKQLASIKAMQELQPHINELKEKYRKNPEKLQKATMELYKEKKINPLAGCLPLLIQMPILIAFYSALLKLPSFIETMPNLPPGALKFLWILNITEADRAINIAGFPLQFAFGSMTITLSIMALLVASATFWQQWVSTASKDDPTQRAMLWTMPLFIGGISMNLPAGLAIYWVMFSALGALQQIYINKKKKPVPAGTPAAPPEEEAKPKKGDKHKK
ncbi:MAG: membrane protein insertase YidC [Firmicutes bacterium]|nr:membrane protein insertase YidC [Bacillota bacterium]